jgi:hypothetical protein
VYSFLQAIYKSIALVILASNPYYLIGMALVGSQGREEFYHRRKRQIRVLSSREIVSLFFPI